MGTPRGGAGTQHRPDNVVVREGRRFGTRRTRDLTIVAVLVALAVALVVAIGFGDGGGADEQAPAGGRAATTPAPTGPLGDLARRVPGDPMALGAVDAPVVMVMFSDYRCPFCAKFSRDTEQELVDEYVTTGTLRIEWRDYPIFGPESTLGAEAGRAAAAQGRFWEFNRAVFASAPERGHPELTPDLLEQFATEAGVGDIARFRTDIADPATASAVQSDLGQASSLGVPSTPAFVINGNPVLGAQPLDDFRAAIERAAGR